MLLHICFLRLAIGTGRGSVAILPVRRAGIIALVCISGRAVGLLIILARLARVLICAGGGIATVVAGGGLIILPRLAVRLLITLARIIPGVKRGNAALRCAWRGGGLGRCGAAVCACGTGSAFAAGASSVRCGALGALTAPAFSSASAFGLTAESLLPPFMMISTSSPLRYLVMDLTP